MHRCKQQDSSTAELPQWYKQPFMLKFATTSNLDSPINQLCLCCHKERKSQNAGGENVNFKMVWLLWMPMSEHCERVKQLIYYIWQYTHYFVCFLQTDIQTFSNINREKSASPTIYINNISWRLNSVKDELQYQEKTPEGKTCIFHHISLSGLESQSQGHEWFNIWLFHISLQVPSGNNRDK